MIRLEEIENYIIDNNQYQIFSIISQENEYIIKFLWGKLDFKYILTLDNKIFKTKYFGILKNDVWYQYSKVTAQQIMFQETKWQHNQEVLYIELPKSFAKNAKKACVQGINNKIK